jgi:hypothetical protein
MKKRNTKAIQKNDLAQIILNQCIICSLILLGTLILNTTVSMKNFRSDLKMQLSKNISLEKIKYESVRIFYFFEEKISLEQDYSIDEKVLEQIKNEDEKINAVKKNSSAPL